MTFVIDKTAMLFIYYSYLSGYKQENVKFNVINIEALRDFRYILDPQQLPRLQYTTLNQD